MTKRNATKKKNERSFLNRNKQARTVNVNGEMRSYRDLRGKILFMDLRTWGEPYEKKEVENVFKSMGYEI